MKNSLLFYVLNDKLLKKKYYYELHDYVKNFI